MPPMKVILYGNGDREMIEIPEQYAERLKEEPLYRVIQDMNKDYEDSKKKKMESEKGEKG